MLGADDRALGPFDDIALADSAERKGRLHRDRRMVMHPADRVIGIGNNDATEFFVRAPAGYPQQIIPEILFPVSLDTSAKTREFLLRIGNQGIEFLDRIEGDAQQPAGPMGVAATHVFRRFFQNRDPLCAIFTRRNRRRQGRITRADNNDVIVVIAHDTFPTIVH